jgi:hypothetical protein
MLSRWLDLDQSELCGTNRRVPHALGRGEHRTDDEPVEQYADRGQALSNAWGHAIEHCMASYPVGILFLSSHLARSLALVNRKRLWNCGRGVLLRPHAPNAGVERVFP